MSWKSNTPRTLIADLAEVGAVSSEELANVEGGFYANVGEVHARFGSAVLSATSTIPGSVTNPGQTDTATDSDQ